jgi:hypothetical protein
VCFFDGESSCFLFQQGNIRCWDTLCDGRSKSTALCEQVLVVIEKKFKERAYTAAQARAVLSYDTESVPVQQFQARCADHLLFTANLQLTKARS